MSSHATYDSAKPPKLVTNIPIKWKWKIIHQSYSFSFWWNGTNADQKDSSFSIQPKVEQDNQVESDIWNEIIKHIAEQTEIEVNKTTSAELLKAIEHSF